MSKKNKANHKKEKEEQERLKKAKELAERLRDGEKIPTKELEGPIMQDVMELLESYDNVDIQKISLSQEELNYLEDEIDMKWLFASAKNDPYDELDYDDGSYEIVGEADLNIAHAEADLRYEEMMANAQPVDDYIPPYETEEEMLMEDRIYAPPGFFIDDTPPEEAQVVEQVLHEGERFISDEELMAQEAFLRDMEEGKFDNNIPLNHEDDNFEQVVKNYEEYAANFDYQPDLNVPPEEQEHDPFIAFRKTWQEELNDMAREFFNRGLEAGDKAVAHLERRENAEIDLEVAYDYRNYDYKKMNYEELKEHEKRLDKSYDELTIYRGAKTSSQVDTPALGEISAEWREVKNRLDYMEKAFDDGRTEEEIMENPDILQEYAQKSKEEFEKSFNQFSERTQRLIDEAVAKVREQQNPTDFKSKLKQASNKSLGEFYDKQSALAKDVSNYLGKIKSKISEKSKLPTLDNWFEKIMKDKPVKEEELKNDDVKKSNDDFEKEKNKSSKTKALTNKAKIAVVNAWAKLSSVASKVKSEVLARIDEHVKDFKEGQKFEDYVQEAKDKGMSNADAVNYAREKTGMLAKEDKTDKGDVDDKKDKPNKSKDNDLER